MTPERDVRALPDSVGQDPFRFDDDTWVGLPDSIDGRARPAHQDDSAPFWTGLDRDEVVLQRCTVCGRYTHFPVGACQWCSGVVEPAVVDGVATVNTFSACYTAFGPGMMPPYVAAIVNPQCEPELQIMTNLVNVRICDVRAGMAVRPVFVHGEHGSLLFYEPDPS